MKKGVAGGQAHRSHENDVAIYERGFIKNGI